MRKFLKSKQDNRLYNDRKSIIRCNKSLRDFKEKYGIDFTVNHNAKMQFMVSLSTNCVTNENCQKNREIKGSICEDCYANTMVDKVYREKLYPKLQRNSVALSSEIIPVEDMPELNYKYVRFEAFGDLINTNHLVNFFNMCKKNPNVNFALWTKHTKILREAKELGYEKPKNLNIIVSSLMKNYELHIDLDWVDKVFTVYDPEYRDEHEVVINCQKKCSTCLLCYTKNDIRYVNENLK